MALALGSSTVRRVEAISDRRLAFCVACVGFVLALPSLGNGLQILDDLPQRDFILAKLQGDAWAQTRPWYDIYNLVNGDPDAAVITRFLWATPWWTWPGLKIQFFRPVSAATLYVDYALFGQHYWLGHLHSALWYFVACGLVTLAALQISRSRFAAVLGALLFAVDDAHSSSVSWFAGRNAIIGVTCFAAGLNLYVLGSRRRQLRYVIAGAASLVTGLLATENVVGAVPFFFAYSLILDRQPLKSRMLHVLVVSATVATWFACHKALGFGSFGSGAYLDPIRDGAEFWRNLPGRCLALAQLQLGPPWALAAYMPLPWFIQTYNFGRWIALPALTLFVVRCFNREIAFWTVSALVGLIPLTAGAPHDRLLTHIGVAWWMLQALMIVALVSSARSVRRALSVPIYSFLAAIIIAHLCLAPWAFALGVKSPDMPDVETRALAATPDWWSRKVVVVNVPTMFVVAQLNWQRTSRRLPAPAAITVLGATDQQVEVVRKDRNTLELFSSGGYLLDVFSNFYRGRSVPLRVDEITVLNEFAVQVLELTPDGRPRRVLVRFIRSLDDPSFFFIYWADQQLKPFRFAPFGQRSVIRPAFEVEPRADSRTP
jgi:hypothetical protein